MTVSDYIIQFFEEKGVEFIFTVSGGGSIFLCDALARAKTMRYVSCHHEQAAGYAAEAYARIRGLGVCLVTSGPGGTNAVSAAASAWLDSVPVVFISGQAFLTQTVTNHPGLRQLGVQEINIIDMVRPITKFSAMPPNADTLKQLLPYAVNTATMNRKGPVWLDICGDIQNASL